MKNNDKDNLSSIKGYGIDKYIKKKELKQGFRIDTKDRKDLYSKEIFTLLNSIKK